MKTTVDRINDTKVKLTIDVTKDELIAAEQVALSKLAKTVKAPGFRKGKVPASVAAKYIDQNKLMEQTLDDALSRAVAEAFLSENLQALARPEVSITKFVPRSELEFTAECEVLPEVKLGEYKKLTSKSEKVSVSAKEVDEIIDRMRSSTAEKKEVKRAAKNGDEVVINFIGKKDGIAFEGGTASDYVLELGSNSFIPGFEDGLVGKKAGDTTDLKLTFPKSYHVADLAGADVVFETTIKKVHEKVLPELTDEFAKKAGNNGVSTVTELKSDIKSELHVQKQREASEKNKDALVNELVEKSKVTAPQVLIDDQAKSIEQDMMQNLMYQNITLDQYLKTQGFKDTDDWREKEVKPASEKRVKAGLVLAELSKELKIDATEEELAEHLAKYQQQYGNNSQVLEQFKQPEVIRDIRNRLITEKTVDALVAANL